MTVLGITVDVIQAAHMRANLVTLGGGGGNEKWPGGGAKSEGRSRVEGRLLSA